MFIGLDEFDFWWPCTVFFLLRIIGSTCIIYRIVLIFRLFLGWFQYLKIGINVRKLVQSNGRNKLECGSNLPETNTIMIHRQSSYRQRYRIHRNSLVPKIMWLTDVWRKIHNHLRQPLVKSEKRKQEKNNAYLEWNPICVQLRSWTKAREKKHTWWPRHISSKSCIRKNRDTTSAPNVKLTPRSFSPQS